MRWFKLVAGELFGLFVDNGPFAIGIIIWLGIVWAVLSRASLPSGWAAVLLFAGLGAILVQSAWRRARR